MEMTFLHWTFLGYTVFIAFLGASYFFGWPRPSQPDHRGQVFGMLFSIETALVGAVLQEYRVQEKEREVVTAEAFAGEATQSLAAVDRVISQYSVSLDTIPTAGDSAIISLKLPAAAVDSLTAATDILSNRNARRYLEVRPPLRTYEQP